MPILGNMLVKHGGVGAPALMTVVSGSGQSANCGAAYALPLVAIVVDLNLHPLPNIPVTFTAPASGASGTFASTGTRTETVVTNGAGQATSSAFTAGATIGGAYNVVASSGALTPANFALTNVTTHQRIAAMSGVVAYYPLNDTSGTDIAESIHAANGTANSVTLNNLAGPYPDMGSAPLFAGVATSYIQLPGASLNTVFSAAAGTLAFWYNLNEGFGIGDTLCPILLGADVQNRVYQLKTAANVTPTLVAGNSINGNNNIGFTAYGWHHFSIRWNKSVNKVKTTTDGLPNHADVAYNGTWVGTLADAWCLLGKYNGTSFPFPGWLQGVMLANRDFTDAEILAASAVGPLTLPQVICDGDSMTAGSFSTPGNNSYPDQMRAALGAGWRVVNRGVNGQTVATMITNAPSVIDPYYTVSRTKNIGVLWGGTNDLGAGADDTTTYGRIVTYCQARRAAGWKWIVCDILPRADAGWTAGMETYRQSVNASIAANWPTFADGFAQLTANPHLQNPNNGTYFYFDKVHLVSAGMTEVTGVVKPVVLLQ